MLDEPMNENELYRCPRQIYSHKQKSKMTAYYSSSASQVTLSTTPNLCFQKPSNSWGRSSADLYRTTSSFFGICLMKLINASLIKIVLSNKFRSFSSVKRISSGVRRIRLIRSTVSIVTFAAMTAKVFPPLNCYQLKISSNVI